jgi:hypothetical protein
MEPVGPHGFVGSVARTRNRTGVCPEDEAAYATEQENPMTQDTHDSIVHTGPVEDLFGDSGFDYTDEPDAPVPYYPGSRP